MKKLFAALFAAIALLSAPTFAGVGAVSNNIIWFNAPTTVATVLSGYCDEGNLAVNLDTTTFYRMSNCAGSAALVQFWPVLSSDVAGLTAALSGKLDVPAGTTAQYLRGDGSLSTFPTSLSAFANGPGYITSTSLASYEPILTGGTTAQYLRGDKTWQTLNKASVGLSSVDNTTDAAKPVSTATQTALNGKFDIPTGATSQYVRGDGTLATLPGASSRAFSYPARALNSCFQVSASQDADVNYSINISATITLGGGTGVLTTYTNSGCTTGAQAASNGAVSSVALLGTSSIPLHAIIPAGKWAKISSTASGGGSAAIDTVQAETTLP